MMPHCEVVLSDLINISGVLGTRLGKFRTAFEFEFSDRGESALRGFDLQDPQAYIDFLIAANIRLVRLEFLKELHENALPMPRRQEAELLRTKDGATALVELTEYKQLRIDKITGA